MELARLRRGRPWAHRHNRDLGGHLVQCDHAEGCAHRSVAHLPDFPPPPRGADSHLFPRAHGDGPRFHDGDVRDVLGRGHDLHLVVVVVAPYDRGREFGGHPQGRLRGQPGVVRDIIQLGRSVHADVFPDTLRRRLLGRLCDPRHPTVFLDGGDFHGLVDLDHAWLHEPHSGGYRGSRERGVEGRQGEGSGQDAEGAQGRHRADAGRLREDRPRLEWQDQLAGVHQWIR
mmetsp:Transcript_31347/g.91454  ORF Transcript_31347/g.91454 Transcript_31347/m.91454 type:complete len:229 (+) Transcript_31347:579-1265(+)